MSAGVLRLNPVLVDSELQALDVIALTDDLIFDPCDIIKRRREIIFDNSVALSILEVKIEVLCLTGIIIILPDLNDICKISSNCWSLVADVADLERFMSKLLSR